MLLERLRARGLDLDAYRPLAAYTPFAVAFRYEGVEDDRDPLPRDQSVTNIEALLADVHRALSAAGS